MHTSLYEEVGSKYGLERGDSIVGCNVQHLHKRDYIRKLTNEAQKADIQKLITEYQEKLEDKSNKLHAKEHELEQLTKDAAKARTDKWIERQNRLIAKQFTEIVRKIESLYRNDAALQVEAAQNNVLADYGELYQLRRENKTLSDANENLESELNTLLGQLAIPSARNMIFAVADALISGQPIPVSSGGGGGNSDSDLRWDGRRPDEEEEAYKRRCLMHAVQVARNSQRKTRNSQRKTIRR